MHSIMTFFLMILVSLFYNYTIVTLIFGGSLEIFVLSFIHTLLQNNSNKNNVFIIYLPLLKFKIPGCGLFRGFFPDYHKEYTAVSKGCSLLLSTRSYLYLFKGPRCSALNCISLYGDLKLLLSFFIENIHRGMIIYLIIYLI